MRKAEGLWLKPLFWYLPSGPLQSHSTVFVQTLCLELHIMILGSRIQGL